MNTRINPEDYGYASTDIIKQAADTLRQNVLCSPPCINQRSFASLLLRFSANIARSFALKPSAKTMQVLSNKTQKVTPFLHDRMHGIMHKIDTKRHA